MTNQTPPEPGLEGRPLTYEEYRAFTPEKLELLSGYLIAPPEQPEERRRLLMLLLVNVGLVETLKLVPEVHWREALDRAFGEATHEGQ